MLQTRTWPAYAALAVGVGLFGIQSYGEEATAPQEAPAPVPSPVPSVEPGMALLEGTVPSQYFRWIPEEPPVQPGQKKKPVKPNEAPVSNVDPEAEILAAAAKVRLGLKSEFKDGVRVEINGHEAERFDEGSTIFIGDAILEGIYTPMEVRLIPHPVPIPSASPSPSALKQEEKFTYRAVYPEWPSAKESHASQLAHPRFGLFRPFLGFTSVSFKQTNAPPLSQFGLTVGLDYTKRALLIEQSMIRASVLWLALPLGSEDVFLQPDVTIQYVDASLLAGYSFTKLGERLSFAALAGAFYGNSKVTANIQGYKNIVWPQVQVEGGYYLTSKQRFGFEVSAASISAQRVALDFTYLKRFPGKWTLHARGGWRSLKYSTFLGDFTSSAIVGDAGISLRF